MKITLLFFLVLTFPYVAASQDTFFERVWPGSPETHGKFTGPLAGHWYHVHNEQVDIFQNKDFLELLDADGNVLWSVVPVQIHEIVWVKDVIADASDSTIFLAISAIAGCDFGSSRTLLQQWSNKGDLLWEAEAGNEIYSDQILFARMGNQLFVVMDKWPSCTFYRIDKGTNQQVSVVLPFKQVQDIAPFGNSLLIASGTKLYRLDLNGQVLDSTDIARKLKQISYTGNVLLGADEEKIIAYDAELKVKQKLQTELYFDSIDLRTIRDKEVLISGWHAGQRKVAAFDPSFQLVAAQSLNVNAEYQSMDLAYTDSVFAVTGDRPYFEHQSVALMKTINVSGEQHEGKYDIGIIDMQVDSVRQKSPTKDVYEFSLYITATFKNFGTQPVESFWLNADNGYGICYPSVTFKEIKQRLDPGDTSTFSGWYVTDYLYLPQLPYTVDACWWTSSPNRQNDIERSNDRYCKQQGVSLAENDPLMNLRVYPIPASDKLNVDTHADQPVRYTLTGTSGAVYFEGEMQGRGEIDVSSLAAGVYILEIQSDSQKRYRKVLLE